MKGKAAALVFIILFAGFGFYGYQLYTAAEGIEVTGMTVSSFEIKGSPIPSKILVEVDLHVKNPTSTSVELERLSYGVYVNDKFAAEGMKNYIFIPANSEKPIRIPAEVTISDVLSLVGSLILEGKKTIDVDVKGMVDVPIKFFGVVRTISISVPFEVSQTYTLPIPERPRFPWEEPQPPPGAKSTSLILDPTPSSISEGTIITFTGRLVGVEGDIIVGDVIEIYDEDPLIMRDDLMASGSINENGRFRITWTAKRMDTWPDKTVEVYAKFIGIGDYQPSKSWKYTITIQ